MNNYFAPGTPIRNAIPVSRIFSVNASSNNNW